MCGLIFITVVCATHSMRGQCLWDTPLWREKVTLDPKMASNRKNPVFTISQDSVALTKKISGSHSNHTQNALAPASRGSMHLSCARLESVPPHIGRSMHCIELMTIIPNRARTLVRLPCARSHNQSLQDGNKVQRHIPPGPVLKAVNEKLADMYKQGIEVFDYPRVGPPVKVLVYPKNILRVGDFPGPLFLRARVGPGRTRASGTNLAHRRSMR